MKKLAALIFTFMLMALAPAAHAAGVSVGGKVSTLGFGLEGEKVLSDSIGVSGVVNYFPYSYSGTESDISYEFDLDFMSIGAVADWHPFRGSFRLSGGIFYNGNELKGKAGPGSIEVGGVDYTLDSLEAKIEFNSVAPYVGLGWNTSFKKERGLGFLFEFGALYQGTPKASLSASGSSAVVSNPTFQANLATEEADLQDALKDYKWHPVIGIGLNYKF